MDLGATHVGDVATRACLRCARHGRWSSLALLSGEAIHSGDPDSGSGLAEHFEHRVRPLSAGVAVPVFAFLASGVTIGGFSGLSESLTTPVARASEDLLIPAGSL